MRANVECGELSRRNITVFLNGKENKDVIEADEEAGYVWVHYQDSHGQYHSQYTAEPGALIYQEIQVIKLKGEVRLEIKPPEGFTVEDIKRECDENFVPITPTVLVAGALL